MMGVLRNAAGHDYSCALGENKRPRPTCNVHDDRQSFSSLVMAQTSAQRPNALHFAQTGGQEQPT